MINQWKIQDSGETLVGERLYSVSTRDVHEDPEFITHIGEKNWVDPYEFFVVVCQAFEMCDLEVTPDHDKAMRKALKYRADGIWFDVVAERWRKKFRPDLEVGMFEAPLMKTAEEMLADLHERV